MADTMDAPADAGRTVQNGLTKKVGPLPLWGWAALGAGLFFVYLRMRNKSAASSTIPLVAAPSGYSLSAVPPDNGSGGGDPNGPPSPVPPPSGGAPPSVPYVPPSGGSGGFAGYGVVGGNTGPFTIKYGNAAAGQTGSMTYYTYNTPTGGPPTPSNPGAGMENWSQQQWNDYAAQIAREWGLSVQQVVKSWGGMAQNQANTSAIVGQR